jgi:hypothetical protein
MIDAGTSAPIADRRKRDADEPGRETVQQQRRHREIIAESLEAFRVRGHVVHARGDHEKADQREQAEHE